MWKFVPFDLTCIGLDNLHKTKITISVLFLSLAGTLNKEKRWFVLTIQRKSSKQSAELLQSEERAEEESSEESDSEEDTAYLAFFFFFLSFDFFGGAAFEVWKIKSYFTENKIVLIFEIFKSSMTKSQPFKVIYLFILLFWWRICGVWFFIISRAGAKEVIGIWSFNGSLNFLIEVRILQSVEGKSIVFIDIF